MRFITEFEIRKDESNKADHVIQYRKERGENGLGYLIAKSFGWENPVNNNKLHHRVEIEAFPMDKWVEFKEKLLDHIAATAWNVSPNHIQTLINKLESFGKPSGDAITNFNKK